MGVDPHSITPFLAQVQYHSSLIKSHSPPSKTASRRKVLQPRPQPQTESEFQSPARISPTRMLKPRRKKPFQIYADPPNTPLPGTPFPTPQKSNHLHKPPQRRRHHHCHLIPLLSIRLLLPLPHRPHLPLESHPQ